MMHLDVLLDDHDYSRARAVAREAGMSMEEWIRDLIRHATQPLEPSDPLFGLLADEPSLADAIDTVVAERPQRVLRVS